MGQAVSTDAAILAALKTWYTDKKFQNLLFRNSPTLRRIPKIKIGGKTYNFAALYTAGGATSGNYTVAVANAANGQAGNIEFSVPPGKMFSVFNINQLEKMSSQTERGAYVKLVVDKMFAANEATRKQAAAALFASGYGEFGTVQAGSYSTSDTTITLNDDAIVKIDIGTTFDVTTTAAPSGALNADGPFTVTGINENVVTYTRSGTTTAFAAGEWLEFHGGRDGSGNPNYPTGLAGWIPSYYNRTGASWNSYIGTAFYGVTRSTYVDRMAGWYYQRDSGASELYSLAISKAVRKVRRGGGIPRLIVLNDNDYLTVQNELQSYRNYWQSVDIKDPAGGPQFTYGIEALRYAFSSTYIEEVYDDPYCQQGKSYILDVGEKDDGEQASGGNIEFAGLSNSNTPLRDGIKDNNPGAPAVDGAPDATENPYQLLIDDYLSIQPATDAADGPAARVSLSLYGNYAVHNPAHTAVIDF